jgi:hypothetical protein
MLFLLRHPEIGKEPRPEKSKARRDIVERIEALLPGARTSLGTGRILVDTADSVIAPAEAIRALGEINGVYSFSPCERCTLADLDERAVAVAARAGEGKRSFAVRVKRVGRHDFSSPEKASQLGALIHERLPWLAVDLAAPELTLGVEIRDDEVHLFDQVYPGKDERTLATREAYGGHRFVVDHMLGTLATRLRLLGFDTSYYRDTADSFLLRKSGEEQRILLTQDRELSRLGGAAAYLVQGHTLAEQTQDVIAHFHLEIDERLVLSRCSICNTPLVPVDKATVLARLPPAVAGQHEEFFLCTSCDKVYWKGPHHERMLGELLG